MTHLNDATPEARQRDRGHENSALLSSHDPIVPQATPKETINYAWIKAQAKARKCSVDALLVQSQARDPFYFGTKGQIKHGKWFAETWADIGFTRAHLRKMHYAILSREGARRCDGKPYENTDPDWEHLNNTSRAARFLGNIPFEDIVDRKQPEPHLHAGCGDLEPSFYVDVPDLVAPDIDVYGFDPSKVQPYHLEVLIEKSTMDSELLPVCKKYGANLVTSEGEFTTSSISELFKRIKRSGKPARIFVIADFDPAGVSIRKSIARRLEYFLHQEEEPLDVRLCSLGLNPDQVEHFQLPRVQIKESETRKDHFEANFGEGGAELDALEVLHPGALRQIVDDALRPFYSPEASGEVLAKERALRQAVHEKVQSVVEQYMEEIAALEPMMEELREIEIENVDRFMVSMAAPTPEADDGFNWLLDSSRSYMEQLPFYHAFAGGAA